MPLFKVTYEASYLIPAADPVEATQLGIATHGDMPEGAWQAEMICEDCQEPMGDEQSFNMKSICVYCEDEITEWINSGGVPPATTNNAAQNTQTGTIN